MLVKDNKSKNTIIKSNKNVAISEMEMRVGSHTFILLYKITQDGQYKEIVKTS